MKVLVKVPVKVAFYGRISNGGSLSAANCSRNIRQEEAAQARKNTGLTPAEFIVGYDALAVFVHRDNPLNEISIPQLAAIYRSGASLSAWSQLESERLPRLPAQPRRLSS